MAALVQPFPPQTATVTMLQTRPSSAGGMLPSQGQPPYSAPQQQRHSVYATTNTMTGAPITYRAAAAPIQPYAFTSTPSLNTWQSHQQSQQSQQSQQPQQPQQQPQNSNLRVSSTAPVLPRMQSFDSSISLGRISRQPTGTSMALSASTSTPAVRYSGSRDDSSLPTQGTRRGAGAPRPQSTYLAGSPPQLSAVQATPVRPSPERYRRSAGSTGQIPQQKQGAYVTSATPSGSGMASVGRLYPTGGSSSNSLQDQQQWSAVPRSQPLGQRNDVRRNSFHDTMLSGMAADDIHLHHQLASEETKRFRRRSMPSLNAADFLNLQAANASLRPSEDGHQGRRLSAPRSPDKSTQRTPAVLAHRPKITHNQDGSTDSVASSRSNDSRQSSTNRRNSNAAAFSTNPATPTAAAPTETQATAKNQDPTASVSIPPRVSSDSAALLGQTTNSKTTAMEDGTSKPSMVGAAGAAGNNTAASASTIDSSANHRESSRPAPLPSHLESPAMRHLSAIKQKGSKPGSKTSKLRRAFSFGSLSELHKAGAGPAEENTDLSGTNKLQKEPTKQELYEAEQARIAQQQEEGGIGSSIYASARIFSGSTDNLSISSTASSASIMIRKMGQGMKKSTRSLVGLFRPKSVIGVPAADSALPEANRRVSSPVAAEATISMVTVEAERDLVNVNPDVRSHVAGGTGFPRLERNSIDASRVSMTSERLGSSGTDRSTTRKSIIEGDKERAEVLAAVRKGILKNTSGNVSPPQGPVDMYDVHKRPTISESPASSAPSTPNDDMHAHKRTGSVTVGGEDYFVSALRLRQDSRSGSSTPQGSMRRCATFSPRLIFHDTWPSQEYDRRGDIATCNRLTPMLAQQIKEELNSFKMEMEVHENSKIYTHFF